MSVTATILPNGRKQFINALGAPLAGGQVYYYVPGTTTLQTTWEDSGQVTQNTNPVVLDAAGSALIFGAGVYREYLTDSLGNLISDSLTTGIPISSAMQPVVGAATTAAAIAALGLASTTVASIGSALIGYFQSIIGWVGRTVSARLLDQVSVLDFGADPTGVADSTEAIQAALTASLSVFFPTQPSGAQATYKVSGVLTMRVNQNIRGAGTGGVTVSQTASTPTFYLAATTLTAGNIQISDLTISGAAASVSGVATVLISGVTVSNVVFSGCASSAINADRGYYHLAENCVSSPNATYQAGPFNYLSSVDTDYCFYPTVRDCKTHGLDELGNVIGASNCCVYFRRCIGGGIFNFAGERLNVPSGSTVNGIVIENDCQGTKIIGGITYGAVYGVLLQSGSGIAAAPGYIDIIGHDVDWFTGGGIYINGATASVCADITIVGGKITAGRSSAVPYLYVNEALKVTISGVVCDDYSASHFGTGLTVENNAVLSVTGCIFDYMDIGISIGSSSSQVLMENNSVTDATTALSGGSNLQGSVSRVFGNHGVNPIAVTTPAVPASGTPVFNQTGSDVLVYISGGSSITTSVGAANIGTSAGPFYLSANNSISLTYGSAPTWIWAPV